MTTEGPRHDITPSIQENIEKIHTTTRIKEGGIKNCASSGQASQLSSSGIHVSYSLAVAQRGSAAPRLRLAVLPDKCLDIIKT